MSTKCRALAAVGPAALSLALAGSATAAFPGTNGKIAFASFDGADTEIVVMERDGTNPTALTSNSPAPGGIEANDEAPAFSADGEKIAFQGNSDGPDSEIFVMDANGQNLTQLTNNAVDDFSPSFSPDGRRIVFSRFDGASFEIFAMNADGSGVTQLTEGDTDLAPTFAPDGQSIAFSRPVGGDFEIFVMGPDGQNPVPLTDNADADEEPSFSPDGQSLTFSRDFATAGVQEEIMVMDATGQNQRQLTNSPPTGDFNPVFSPDGLLIAFNTSSDEIFVMDTAGQNQTNLTNSPAEDSQPAWQPLNPPVVDVTAGKQKSPKKMTVTVVAQNEDATVTLDGSLAAPKPKPKAAASKKKTVELDAVTLQLEPGVPVTVELPVAGKGKKLLKKALKAGKKPKGTITASATDDLGATAQDSLAVKLKRKRK